MGSDEAGTGDYFGPVTVASAYVDEEHIKILKEIGVQDSKKITDQTIQKLTKEILRLRIPYTLLNLHNEKYNKLQQQGWTQGKMKTLLHHHAIKKLLKKVPNRPLEGILIDQFCMPDVYKRHLSSENESLPNRHIL
ncbi:ribonuclease HIII [Paracerasibacillus soli]|uniref:Ribonuclease n=1 Tax=Paracerasibacillus soli TaxID=480284 RepID=A0ABU5CQI4_9BACI|nr:ribonuclease HIII [Virgibacillus soli]MDY0408617.1 ribonuclease HIII [Virgibacillus soli]